MMRKWLDRNRPTTINNFMIDKGFILDNKHKWWFNDSKKIAISERDAIRYTLESLVAAPFQYNIRKFLFLSSIKLNPDCLDTIYLKYYNSKEDLS